MSKFEMSTIRDSNGRAWGNWSAMRIDPSTIDLKPMLGFGDRDGYLAWVSSWKEAYARTISDIREARASGYRSRRESLRIVAHNLLVVRHGGKAEAALQWRARRNQLAA